MKTGDIVGADFSYHVVPFDIDPFDGEAFRQNPMEFWLVATDILTGEPVYHQMHEFNHHELEWMRASASMPAVSHPVEVDGMVMLDGGMVDAIPLKKFQQACHEMYNAELEYITEQEQRGNALLIYPSEPLKIGRTELNEKKMRRVYGMGYDMTDAMKTKIREFVESQS